MTAQQPKVSIERAMEITLDEYILESGLYVPPMFKQPPLKKNDETKVEQDNSDHKISNGVKEPFDLRDKFRELNITSPRNTQNNNKNNSNSHQQLLQLSATNSGGNCNSNTPPAISLTDVLNSIQGKRPGNRKRNRNRRNRGQFRNMNKLAENRRMNFNGNQSSQFLNGKIQRRPYQQRNNYLKQQDSVFKNQTTTIECTIPEFSNLRACLTNNANTSTNFNNLSLSNPNTLTVSEFKPEIMSSIAGKLISFLLQNNQQNSKPKYDLTLQKEIHAIQGKQMAYKCPGGEVISSDGAGIECKLMPTATGVSLNQRFA